MRRPYRLGLIGVAVLGLALVAATVAFQATPTVASAAVRPAVVTASDHPDGVSVQRAPAPVALETRAEPLAPPGTADDELEMPRLLKDLEEQNAALRSEVDALRAVIDEMREESEVLQAEIHRSALEVDVRRMIADEFPDLFHGHREARRLRDRMTTVFDLLALELESQELSELRAVATDSHIREIADVFVAAADESCRVPRVESRTTTTPDGGFRLVADLVYSRDVEGRPQEVRRIEDVAPDDARLMQASARLREIQLSSDEQVEAILGVPIYERWE